MPKRIATISVTVIRENDTGKRVRKTIEPGKAYNFTEAEIKQITAIHPTALRKPVNETAVEIEEPVEGADDDDDLGTEGDEAEDEGGEETPPAAKAKPKGKPKAKPAAADADDDI